MNPDDIMAAFPPTEDKQVTLANWRQHPFSKWSFRNVRQLLPTANISRAEAPVPLELASSDIDDVAFEGLDGGETTVFEALRAGHTDGFMVLHRGSIVAERYDNGLNPGAQHLIFSVSKSIAGTLGGVLADQGKLDPEAPVLAYIHEMKGSVYDQCAVRHLLDMSVGVGFDEEYAAIDGDVVRYRLATGWDVKTGSPPASSHLREYLKTLQSDGTTHGHTFHYVSPNTDVLGWVCERACGMAYAQILQRYLWRPMGAEDDAYITVDSRGAARAAGGICASLRDLARFGKMMRNGGVSTGGKQLVPAWWIDDMRRNGNAAAWSRGKLVELFPNGNYRSCWYTPDREHGDFCAIGIHGQWIYIDPATEIVIARVSSQPVAMDLDLDRMWLRGYRAIAATLRSSTARSRS